MAAAFDPTELKNLLECGICLNRFQDPRVLPCLHSYCLGCLKSHILSSKDQDGAFNCPQCREKCLLPGEGADKFPKNFFVNTMKDVLPESILQEPSQEAAESSGPIMCKHHDIGSEDEHGEAVSFCVQCDAHFCQLCTKHHSMFIKDHNVTPVGRESAEPKLNANCKLHQKFPINWYCTECEVPACSECLIDQHDGHSKERLTVTEAFYKNTMLDVSMMAAKRIKYLEKMSGDMKLNELKMNDELDKVNKDISDTADDLCKLVRQREATLKDKVRQAREESEKHFEKTQEGLQTAKQIAMSLKSRAESLHQASDEQALCTVLQAPMVKQQYLHQQETPVPSTQLKVREQTYRSEKEDNPLGTVDLDISTEPTKTSQAEDVLFGKPVCVTKLEYTGEKCACSITSLFESKICVAHFYEREIFVYSHSGELQQKVEVSGIERITGMVALDVKKGKLAIVDDKESKIHFVTLSGELAVKQHVTAELPIQPYHISIGDTKKLLVVSSLRGKRVVLVTLDGQVISEVELSIPNASFSIRGILQTKNGYAVCDRDNKCVYFTDRAGTIVKTYTDCDACRVLGTSLGHIIVSNCEGYNIKIFSEAGDYLGKTNTTNVGFPYCMHLNEVERLLYVSCGTEGNMEVQRYKFSAGDLPLLPIMRNETTTNVRVNLQQVY